MHPPIKLKRSGPVPFAPAPRAVRAGDYVFTSSIYPVDSAGHAVMTDERLGEAGPSLITAQTRHCFEALKTILEEHGSSLDRVLKAEVHLVDAADFYEFKLVWRKYFPNDPPARTAVEVGDTLPFRGARLNLDVVALAGDSKLERQALRDPEGPDPLAAEAASWAVRAGNLVFCSGFAASNFTTGLAAGKKPGFPNYGNDAVSQAEYFFDALNRVLAQAGTSLEQALEAYLYEADLKNFYDASLTVLVPDQNHVKEESRRGIKYHPVNARKVNYTPTLTAGPWIYIAGKTAGDMQTVHSAPAGLPHHFSDIEVQTRHVVETLTVQIEANGSDWEHCHHVRVWLTHPQRDYRGFIRVWCELFPDPAKAPALAYVPATATMYPGPLIEIDPTCVARA
jgi:enamine deaminase RidA (YjgF/YER057c/UK114 family)